MTERIELLPLLGSRLEIAAVGGDAGQAEISQTRIESSTDLAPDFPEACPAHAQARQRPLEKLDTLGVVHAERSGDPLVKFPQLMFDGEPLERPGFDLPHPLRRYVVASSPLVVGPQAANA